MIFNWFEEELTPFFSEGLQKYDTPYSSQSFSRVFKVILLTQKAEIFTEFG